MADLLSVQTVAQHLRLDDAAEQTGLLSALIDAAQDTIERIANRSLAVATSYTEYHTPMVFEKAGCVFVTRPPITGAPTVYDDRRYAARLISSGDIIQRTDDGGLNFDAGKVELWNDESTFTSGRLNVTVTYVGGWTRTTFPQDLQRAWIALVQYWFENPDRVGLKTFEDGGYSVEWEQAEVPDSLMRVFEAYRMMEGRY